MINFPPIAMCMIFVAAMTIAIIKYTRQNKFPDFELNHFLSNHHEVAACVSTSLAGNLFKRQFGQPNVAILDDKRTAMALFGLVKECNTLLESHTPFAVHFDSELMPSALATNPQFSLGQSLNVSNFDKKRDGRYFRSHIEKVLIKYSVPFITLYGLRIGSLVVEHGVSSQIHCINCSIKNLILVGGGGQLPELTLSNCHINVLELRESCCRTLNIIGGMIGQILCPPSSRKNPIEGAVQFQRAPILNAEPARRINDVQPYRNFIAHLLADGNTAAVKYVSGFARRLERKDDSWLIRSSSVLYDAFSFYGNSPERAITWLLGLTIYSVGFLFFVDNGVLPTRCDELVGWQNQLCGEETRARFLRSLVMGMQPLFSPITLLARTSLVIPQYLFTNVWLTFQFLASIGLVTMIAIGFRRRWT